MDDRVGDWPGTDELFLSEFRLEVAALSGQVFGADDRERDEVVDSGLLRGSEQIGGRRVEELHRRTVLEGRRVRDVDDDGGALENLGQTFTRENVHTGRRRRGDGVMAAFSQGMQHL